MAILLIIVFVFGMMCVAALRNQPLAIWMGDIAYQAFFHRMLSNDEITKIAHAMNIPDELPEYEPKPYTLVAAIHDKERWVLNVNDKPHTLIRHDDLFSLVISWDRRRGTAWSKVYIDGERVEETTNDDG